MGAAGTPVREGRVEVNGISMYYREAGEGFPLLGIMGLGANSDWWPPEVVEDLAARYRFLMPDNRGAGRTDCPSEEWTLETNAEDLAAFMDALGVERAHVMGFSMGGMIAQLLAIRFPHRVEKLILGCTTCGTSHGIPVKPELVEAMSVFFSGTLTPEEVALKTAEMLYCRRTLEERPELVREFVSRHTVAPISNDGLTKQVKAVAQFDSYDLLERIKAPTLVMVGEDDFMLPAGNSDILYRRIPGARMIKFAPAGHGFLSEVPEFTSIVRAFLG